MSADELKPPCLTVLALLKSLVHLHFPENTQTDCLRAAEPNTSLTDLR